MMSDIRVGCRPWDAPKPKREQRVIIFDSPDGTGKTEMAWALSQELGIPYFRMDTQHKNWRQGRFKEALEFDQTYISDFLRQTKCNVVIDRAYPAEWVYSQVYRRETNMDVLERVDRAFAQLGTYIIIPLRHDYSNNKKDELVTPEMLPRLHEKYLEFRKWTKCSTITIYVDAFGNSLQREIPAIRSELHWDADLGISVDVTLDRFDERKDVKSIFDVPPDHSRGVDFKKKV